MKHSKTKILFIVSEFYQAGTQRFTYEVHKAINKDKNLVDLLCYLPLGNSAQFSDYYYNKHLKLGAQIFFLSDVNPLFHPSLWDRLKCKLFGIPLPNERLPFRSFLDKYDVLAFMGEYNFPIVSEWLTDQHKQKSVIHIMNSRTQTPWIFDKFDKNQKYNFISGFNKKAVDFEFCNIKQYNHFYFNLNFEIQNKFIKSEYNVINNPKLGIFTRLTPNKPLDFFFRAFKDLLIYKPNANLHIYGSGDPFKEGLISSLESLNILDKVIFHGHQNNILETSMEHKLDLIWLHGYHGVPGGYSGFELCTTCIPHLFWNCTDTATTNLNPIFPMFTDPKELALESLKLLDSPEVAKTKGAMQRNYIDKNFNIRKYIAELEVYYGKIAYENLAHKSIY